MQIKTTVTYHFTPVRMAIIKKSTNNKCWKGCGEKRTLFTVGLECKLAQLLWITYRDSSKKLKIKLPYDPVIPLQGTLSGQNHNTKTILYTQHTVLFTIAKTWKQPECPPADEWIKKMWYIQTMQWYSAIKKNEIMPSTATWMDLEIIILSEVRKRKTIPYHTTYIRNLKYGTNEPIYKTESLIGTEIRLLVAKAGGKGSEKDALVTWGW